MRLQSAREVAVQVTARSRVIGGVGVIAELITIVMGIDFCLPNLLWLLWGLS